MDNQNSVVVSRNEAAIVSKRLLLVLKEYKGRPFVLVEPGGNNGDQLIYKGFHNVANTAGINFVSVSHDDYMKNNYSPDTVVYIHGGGGYIPIWSGTPAQALQKSLSRHRGVVISGPTTFIDDKDYLSKTFKECFKENVTTKVFLFTRENTSFSLIKSYLPGFVELERDHDTALNLMRNDLVNGDIKQKYNLFGIRQDKEMTSRNAYDYLNWMDPVSVTTTFDDWVMLHAQAKEIITNRTHSSVVGSILGIPTTLLPNSYHKNRSIWEYSLQSRGVLWKDQLSGGWINKVIESRGRLRSFFTSSKYRSFRKNLLVNFSI